MRAFAPAAGRFPSIPTCARRSSRRRECAKRWSTSCRRPTSFLPSGDELFLLSEATDETAAVRELLDRGIRTIVVKKGAEGSICHDADGSCSAPAFPVEEVDATGAGDTFSATFVTCWLRGHPAARGADPRQRRGALAVQRRGPMEGTSTHAEIEAFLSRQTPKELSMSSSILADLPRRHASGERVGLTSVCSAHPIVIEAALRQGKEDGTAVLIEATCNQVNQEGGYTGMTPADFRAFVEAIADRVGLRRARR